MPILENLQDSKYKQ